METTTSQLAADLRKAPLGRGFFGFDLGDKIQSISEIRTGDVLIYVTTGSGGVCVNTIACLRTASRPVTFGEIAYFQFLKTPFAAGGFSLWNHELGRVDLYRATNSTPHTDTLMAYLRKHAAESDGYGFGEAQPAPERAPLASNVARIEGLEVRINPNLE